MECSKTFLKLNMHFVIQTSPFINKIRCLLKGILYIYQNKDFLDHKSQLHNFNSVVRYTVYSKLWAIKSDLCNKLAILSQNYEMLTCNPESELWGENYKK